MGPFEKEKRKKKFSSISGQSGTEESISWWSVIQGLVQEGSFMNVFSSFDCL